MTLATASATGKSAAAGVARDPRAADLPTLRLPYNTPAFRREDYERQPQWVYGDLPMQTGSARRRRRYLAAPEDISCSLEMNLEQAQAFHAWYEGPLKTGQEYFAAEVANAGPGTLWWKTRLVEPYVGEYLGGLWWKATLKLRVYGVGSYSAPEASDLKGGVAFDFFGTGELTVGSPLSGGVVFDLALNPAVQALVGGVSFELLNNVYSEPPSVGAAVGSAAVSGVGTASVFEYHVSGVSTVLGVGRPLMRSTAVAAGSSPSVAVPVGQRAVAASVGTSTASGAGGTISQVTATGAATGTSSVTAVSKRLMTSTAAASGVSVVLGQRPSFVGAASGTGTATGVGRKLVRSTGAATGAAVVTGVKYVPASPTWQSGTFTNGLASGEKFTQVVAGSGTKFLAISPSYFYYSTNGSSWTRYTAPELYGTFGGATAWKQVAWNGTTWCLTGPGDYYTLVSTDGINWSVGGANAIYSGVNFIVWNGTNFVLYGSFACSSSPDGATWTSRAHPGISIEGMIADTATGRIYVYGSSGFYTSTDSGATWTNVPGNVAKYGYERGAYFGAFNGSVFIFNPYSVYEFDSTVTGTWTSRDSALFEDYPYYPGGLSSSGSRFYVSRTAAGDALQYSTDNGATWTTDTLPSGADQGALIGNASGSVTVLLPSTAGSSSFRYRA